jgi:hypothetical protein
MDQSSRKNNAGSNQQPPARTGGGQIDMNLKQPTLLLIHFYLSEQIIPKIEIYNVLLLLWIRCCAWRWCTKNKKLGWWSDDGVVVPAASTITHDNNAP